MSLDPEAIEALNAQLEEDGGLFHNFVHGDADAEIETEGGPVPSLAKFIADSLLDIDGKLDVSAVSAFIMTLLDDADAAAARTTLDTPSNAEMAAAIVAAINALVGGAPGALDTLNELAAALADDANFAATVTTSLAGKQSLNSNLTAIAGLVTETFGRSLLTAISAAAARTLLAAAGFADLFRPNILINGDGRVDQDGAGAAVTTADDAYGSSDMWYSLTQTASISVQRLLNGADGIPFYQQLKQTQATAQRMGRATIVPSEDARRYRGSPVTLSAMARSTAATKVNYAILGWASTANIVASDVVNNWASTNFTPGNFFIASVDVVAMGSFTLAANTWASLTDLTGSPLSTCNNLILAFWTDAAVAQNVTLDFKAKLEAGSFSTLDLPRPYADEETMCMKYFYRMGGSAFAYFCQGLANTSSTVEALVTFPPMWTAPTVVPPSPGDFQMLRGGPAADTVTALSFTNVYKSGCRVSITVTGTPLTANWALIFRLGSNPGTIDFVSRL